MKRTLIGLSLLFAGASVFFASCSSKTHGVSDKTGWNYNDPRLGGFDVNNYPGQQTGPGLVEVEGGLFVMGQTEEDVTFSRDNIPRRVTVSSFYMDETEVANVHYREYLYFMERTYGADYPEYVAMALPDTNVWRNAFSYNEAHVNYYFRHAAYNYYPVVGVNWYQANAYCEWRTHRVNEMILIKTGALKKNPNQVNEDVFTTESYVVEQYLGIPGKGRKANLNPTGAAKRNFTYTDGILLPNYRLPTEAEWEYAALGLIEKNPDPRTKRRRGEEAITDRKIYPWGDVRTTRSGHKGANQGLFYANYKRGRGDYMGTVGGLNDNAAYTEHVYSYAPNAYGLYNMAGNVNEWVLDVYRPTAHLDLNDLNPGRGTGDGRGRSEFTKSVYEEDLTLTEKDSFGNLLKVSVDSLDLAGRYDLNYDRSDLRSYKDGDTLSGFTYDYGKTTTINDDSRVFKGGSWKDRSYWLSPGTRRYKQAAHSSADLGFRCAMDRLGSQVFDGRPGGNDFGKKRRGKNF